MKAIYRNGERCLHYQQDVPADRLSVAADMAELAGSHVVETVGPKDMVGWLFDVV